MISSELSLEMKWIARWQLLNGWKKSKKERRCSFSDNSDHDIKKEDSSQRQEDDGDLSLSDYEEDAEEYHNIINMMEK